MTKDNEIFNQERLNDLRTLFEIYQPVLSIRASYGTAGFRLKSAYLDWIVVRMGCLSAIRSIQTNSAIGLMITASHNPASDNGVKIIDPEGEMLSEEWEHFANELVEFHTSLDCYNRLLEKVKELNSTPRRRLTAEVIVAYDTRRSSPVLAEIALKSALCFNVKVQNLGVLSTPQLHFIIRCQNNGRFGYYGEPSENGYFTKLSTAFCSFLEFHRINTLKRIAVDCANGVGAPKLKSMIAYIQEKDIVFPIDYYNTEISDDNLNDRCGADYVKICRTLPRDFMPQKKQLCCSFDGDADRIIYFFIDDDDNFTLIDGDKLAALFALYLSILIADTGVDLTIGVVLTAYSNSKCMTYIKENLKLPVIVTYTGVKHLHEAAKTFDVGIYFEANGHGTVLFNDHFKKTVASLPQFSSLKQRQALLKLKYLMQMTNEAVGDAISNFLLVSSIIHVLEWSVDRFYRIYSELPSYQSKVSVPDKFKIKLDGPECLCIEPEGLQDSLNAIVASFGSNARAFLRPSGTEDIVRIYAEADTMDDARSMASQISAELPKFLGSFEI